MPDDVERPAPVRRGRPRVFDHIDEAATFALHLPAWCGSDGMPRSWAHFQLGLAIIARNNARDSLRMASAVKVPTMDKHDADNWWAEISLSAGEV